LSHGSEEATAALAKAIMLNQYEAVSYLLQHKLLSPAHVVAGDVKVVDVSRRHHNYKVTTAEGPGYVMKQGVGQDRVAAIEREAAVYQFLVSGTKELSHYLPRFCAYDAEECALILELVDGAENLREYHLHRGYFPVSVARVLGNALGTLHRLTEARKNEEEHRIRGQPPWVFSVHRPVIKFLQECSSANLQLIQIVQQFPVFCNLLDALREEWRIEALIHGDIRWDNCIVFGKSSSARKCRLKIVDWELASMGDPCWDVASVFNDYLSFWLLSIPVTGEMPPDRFLELARYPLEKMHPALQAFWGAYVQRMNFDVATADRCLLRTGRYVAARLVQTAFEQTQMTMQLTGNIACMLQLGLNILQRPHEATAQLLGIPLRGARLP
jgi:aminoglycoside phosphotransferase (APT) family kinase protein